MAPIPDADWARVREPLALLLKELASTQSPEELQRVREAIVHAVLSGQNWETIDPLASIPAGPNDITDQQAKRREGVIIRPTDYGLVDNLRPLDASAVVSQQVVLRPFGIHESSQLFVRNGNGVKMVPVSIFGPLRDLLGRRLELAVFKQTTFRALRDGVHINTNLSPTPNNPYLQSFGTCTLWVPAAAFVSSAPSNGHFGLRVRSGTALSPPAPGSQVVVQLEPQTPWEGTLATRFSRAVPSSLTITYSGGTGRPTLTTSMGATATAFGNILSFQYSGGTAEYDAANGRILFPLTTTATRLTLSGAEADLVRFSGAGQLTRAYWAIPVVPFTVSGRMAPVAGNGAILLRVAPGLRSQFASDPDTWTYGDVELAIDETAASISGLTAWTSSTRSLNLWIHGNPATQPSTDVKRSAITLKSKSINVNALKRGFAFKYVIQANGQESWTYSTALSASLSSPISIDGVRTSFVGVAAVFFTRARPGALPIVSVEGRVVNIRRGRFPTSYLMENMLITVDQMPYVFVYGEYSPDDRAVVTGSLNLPTSLLRAAPTLPDPYVTNIVHATPEFFYTMMIQLLFDGVRPVIANIQLPSNALNRISALDGSPFDSSTDPTTRFKLPASELWDKINSEQIDLWERYSSLEPFLRNEPALLDISSNNSQLGVSFTPRDSPVTVNNMTFSTAANTLKVFCLPTVQWEAVYIEDATTPGSGHNVKYDSASGLAGKIATTSADLVPVTPNQLVQKAVRAFNPPSPFIRPHSLTAYFQLPFGMLAQATAPSPSRKSVKLLQPSFLQETPLSQLPPFPSPPTTTIVTTSQTLLTAASTITFRPHPTAASPTSSPFPGISLLPSLTHSRTSPYPDVITSQFNLDFSTTTPLTQFTLSGYGASIFSTYSPSPLPNVGISKVEMDVLVGRARRQVVQMTSVMYPFGVRVIRTVTILRGNNGVVRGVDSGWVAVGEGVGVYDFGEAQSGQERLKTHQGLVRGVRGVRNIRLLAGSDNLTSYDCEMEIEGLLDGGGGETTGWVTVQRQTGYIVTRSPTSSEPPRSLTANQYAQVLRDISGGGPGLGGPVDVVVRLGHSRQKVRVSRILAGSCINDATRGLEFPMELWGTPIVPASGGQWAFTTSVKRELGKHVQEGVNEWGVPIVRKGLDTAASLAGTIRVADAFDLLNEGSAYNLIHSADSYRVMFPSPELIPGGTPGEIVKGLTSKVPILADGFALATSASGSIFPDLDTCIPLEGANKVLDVLDGGHYEYKAVLEEGAKLALKEAERYLRQDGNFASVVSTVGNLLPDGTNNAYLDMAISTVTGAKDLSLSNLSMITQGAAGKELNRVVGSILSSAKNLPIFKDAEHLFGELLGQVQKVVNFLNKLKVLPPLKVSMTNEWAMEVSTSMGLDDFLQRLGVGPGADAIKDIIQVLNFAIKARTTPSSANFTLSVDVTIKIPTGMGPTVLGVGGFLVRAGTDGNVVQMTIGAGIGVEMKIGPFGASAYYTQSQSIIISEEIYGVAATCVLKVHVNLVVATADLLLEARLGLIGGPCKDEVHGPQHHSEDTIYAYAQVRIALHVSIFLVINVSVDETASWENNMNGGPCKLVDLKPMP